MTDLQKLISGSTEERRERALTDADVKALAEEFESRLVVRFYDNLGRGVWAMALKFIIGAVVFVAAYGSVKGLK